MRIDPRAPRVPSDRTFLPVCTICVQRRPKWTAVLIRGELDLAATDQLRASVEAELKEGRPVLLELGGLDFCDVPGVNSIVDLVEGSGCSDRPAGVEVHGARGQVRELMRRTNVLGRLEPGGEPVASG